MGYVTLNEDEFDELFPHVASPSGSFYWDRAEVIRAGIPDNRIWTALDATDGGVHVVPGDDHGSMGFALVVTALPWTTEEITAVMDDSDDDEDEWDEPDYGSEREE